MPIEMSYDADFNVKRFQMLLDQYPDQYLSQFRYLWCLSDGEDKNNSSYHSRFLGESDDNYDGEFRRLLDHLFQDMCNYRSTCNQYPWHGVYVVLNHKQFTIEWFNGPEIEQLFETMIEFSY
ncbi:hypothetical protein [Vibrio sp. MA40-2]|uniref:hypothetical protein n=1 Tax=Vibrio sp. MA40-2 TaxID=3391828 RepID=UPI0039A70526